MSSDHAESETDADTDRGNETPTETNTTTETDTATGDPSDETATRDELRGQLELLQAENQRLRREYVRARQTKYRRTALGLALIGVVAVGGGALFPGSRDVLLALGGSALVAGMLTYYLTPEEFVTATVGEALATTLQDTYDGLRDDLNLQGKPVYVPLTGESAADARLFLPQHHDYTIPDEDALQHTIVVPAEPSQRGLAVRPSGAKLLAEFRSANQFAPQPEMNPEQVFDQLADGLVEQFELADQITPTIEADTRCVLAVTGSTYGAPDSFDHLITSFVAVGAAIAFNTPTRITVQRVDDHDFVFECTWKSQDTNEADTQTSTTD